MGKSEAEIIKSNAFLYKSLCVPLIMGAIFGFLLPALNTSGVEFVQKIFIGSSLFGFAGLCKHYSNEELKKLDLL